jgi:hypothetical protein
MNSWQRFSPIVGHCCTEGFQLDANLICQLFLVFPEFLESYSERCCLWLQVFSPLISILSKFQVLHQDIWFILKWFLYRVRDKDLEDKDSLLHVNIQFFQHHLLKRLFFLQHVVLVPLLSQMAVAAWIYFLFHWSMCLFFVLADIRLFLLLWLCTVTWNIELWYLSTLFYSWLLCYLGSFVLLYEF